MAKPAAAHRLHEFTNKGHTVALAHKRVCNPAPHVGRHRHCYPGKHRVDARGQQVHVQYLQGKQISGRLIQFCASGGHHCCPLTALKTMSHH